MPGHFCAVQLTCTLHVNTTISMPLIDADVDADVESVVCRSHRTSRCSPLAGLLRELRRERAGGCQDDPVGCHLGWLRKT